MRTLVDLDESDVEELDQLAEKGKRSRASLIREAIREYLNKRSAEPHDEAFGLWADRKVDGLAYQRKVRAEW